MSGEIIFVLITIQNSLKKVWGGGGANFLYSNFFLQPWNIQKKVQSDQDTEFFDSFVFVYHTSKQSSTQYSLYLRLPIYFPPPPPPR